MSGFISVGWMIDSLVAVARPGSWVMAVGSVCFHGVECFHGLVGNIKAWR